MNDHYDDYNYIYDSDDCDDDDDDEHLDRVHQLFREELELEKSARGFNAYMPSRMLFGSSNPPSLATSSVQQQQQLVVERTARGVGESSSTPTKNTIESKGISSSSKRDESIGKAVDGVCCSICTESWSSEGDHQVSCLPCGHVYGLSCIKKWIERSSSSKCPQCNKKCGLKDIITLYVSRLSVADDEQQKKILSLQTENEFLKMKFKGECKEMNRIMSEMSRDHEEKYKRLAGQMDDMGKLIRRNLNEAYKRQDE